MRHSFEHPTNNRFTAKGRYADRTEISWKPQQIPPSKALLVPRCLVRMGSLLFLLVLVTFLRPLNGQSDITPAMGDLPIIGGPGGDFFRETCPAGAFVTGFALHTGDDVDAIEHLCLGPGDYRDRNNPWHGGTGGSLQILLCPAATPAVIGIDVAAEGKSTTVVNNIHVYCALATGRALVTYPEAVFDGPPANISSGFLSGSFARAPVHGHETCPPGTIATGLIGRAGAMLDAMGLNCKASSGPTPADPNAKSIGRANGSPTSPPRVRQSMCDSAASARTQNSPAAPTLEAQCKVEIAAREQADMTPGPSGAPVSVCDAAQAALNRTAPEAADLVAKCRADGGGQNLVSEAAQYASQGQTIAGSDPLIAEFQKRQPYGPVRRGFDIGIAATGSDQVWGPGKQRILDSLAPAEQEGFKVAASFVMDRNRNAQLAAIGAAIAAADPIVAQARTMDPDVRYWLGFDIASALFGDPAQGSEGSKSTGPGSARICAGLSPAAQRGFNASTKLHLSRSY